MPLDEGYIKYQSRWKRTAAPDPTRAALLEEWRRPLYDKALVGYYEEHGVGYGNLSVRGEDPAQFLITGTQTGHLATTTTEHYALVTAYDIPGNTVHCTGPIQASSEAMTHAALYALDNAIGAVVHVHHATLWHTHLNKLPTTDARVAYGTPEMATEFSRLYSHSDFRERGVAVMAGHDEGIVFVDKTIESATHKALALLDELNA